ncbi:hypothetical protein PG991_003241 [Apiospora marii]|uniref:Uncharacterized protein n=1 Tax=Apiospora marii TaxID=335849 RepID=A0ABR1SK07_9PEZI
MSRITDRDETFETTRRFSGQSYDIIVVHGFGTRDLSHAKHVLEDWITSEANKKNLRSHCYAFDANRLLIEDEASWRKECDNFRRWLDTICVPDSPAAQADVILSARPEERQQRDNASLLFVAHGLAAWILKRALSSENSNIDSRFIAIVHLDGPWTQPYLDGERDLYAEYIQKLAEKLYKPLANTDVSVVK